MRDSYRGISKAKTVVAGALVAGVLTAGVTMAGPDGASRDVAALARAERVWVESLQSGDAKRLATIIDDAFLFIGPDGERETRDVYLGGYAAMAKAGVVVERIDMDEVETRVLGDVGIVTGHVLARVKMQGTPIQENVRFTRVYRRSPRGWQMIVGQGTRIAPLPAK
jgi:ketosteroid isomerase-like protein